MYKIHIRFFVPYFLYSMSSFLHIEFFSFFEFFYPFMIIVFAILGKML